MGRAAARAAASGSTSTRRGRGAREARGELKGEGRVVAVRVTLAGSHLMNASVDLETCQLFPTPASTEEESGSAGETTLIEALYGAYRATWDRAHEGSSRAASAGACPPPSLELWSAVHQLDVSLSELDAEAEAPREPEQRQREHEVSVMVKHDSCYLIFLKVSF